MPTRKPIRPPGVPLSSHLTPAIQAGGFLFISGQAAVDAQRNPVSLGNTSEQAEFIFKRMKIILEDVGAGFADVVTTTTYLAPEADFEAYNKVRARYYPQDPPASASVRVAGLMIPEMLIEIQAIATIPDKG